ncbi:MAG: glutamine cyclotransferase [Actinomycetota bacterium]|nr:MAG: glutamine cyclotransferase [Actinomycetota bacterium]
MQLLLCVFFTLLACSNSAENLPSVSNDPIIVNPTPEPVTIMPTPKLPPTASPTKSEIAHAEIATMRVISTRPHDETAFTQGLEFYGDRLFESRGLRGSSGLAEINASDGEVLRDISLAPQLFGEGITIVGDTIIQLTWTSGKAFVYDIETLSVVDQFEYEGEGWGLCFDGTSLYMSDGSDILTLRDPVTFAITGSMKVTSDLVSVNRLNELECVDNHVYANMWQTDTIIGIDTSSGHVDRVIDASALQTYEGVSVANVLNGIAYSKASDSFLVTGKLWPLMFEVVFE